MVLMMRGKLKAPISNRIQGLSVTLFAMVAVIVDSSARLLWQLGVRGSERTFRVQTSKNSEVATKISSLPSPCTYFSLRLSVFDSSEVLEKIKGRMADGPPRRTEEQMMFPLWKPSSVPRVLPLNDSGPIACSLENCLLNCMTLVFNAIRPAFDHLSEIFKCNMRYFNASSCSRNSSELSKYPSNREKSK